MERDRRAERVAGVERTFLALDATERPLADVDAAMVGGAFVDMVDQLMGRSTPPSAHPPANLHLTRAAPGSGAGFRHWTPDGALVVSLIESWMAHLARSQLRGQQIGTPHLYRWMVGAPLHELAETFEDRLFIAREGDEAHVLRYGGDPGFFDFAATLGLRVNDLPVRMWEFGPSWRRSRSGELRGIERLHEFRFLDHHTICRQTDALDEYERLLSVQLHEMQRLVGSTAVHFTTTRADYPKHRSLMRRIAATLGTPVVVEVVSRRTHYWSLKSFVFVPGPYQTCNLQLDDINGARFDLVGGSNEVSVIHATLCSAERMVLIMSAWAQSLPNPSFPTWLSPVQLRLLPVRDDVDLRTIFEPFSRCGLRVEIDDRPRSVAWRRRQAAASWVPFTVVVGPSELATGTVELMGRDGSRQVGTPAALATSLADSLDGFPLRGLSHTRTRERYWAR